MRENDFQLVCSNVKDILSVYGGTVLCLKYDNTLWGWGSNKHHLLVRNKSKVDIMEKVNDITKPTFITDGIIQLCNSGYFVGIGNELLESGPDGLFSPLEVILKNVRKVNNTSGHPTVLTTIDNKSYFVNVTYSKDFSIRQVSLKDLNCEVKKTLVQSNHPFQNIVFIDESNDLWIYYSDLKERRLVEKNVTDIFSDIFSRTSSDTGENFYYVTLDFKQYKCAVNIEQHKVKKSFKRNNVRYLETEMREVAWISADNTLIFSRKHVSDYIEINAGWESIEERLNLKEYSIFSGAKDIMNYGTYVLDLDDNLWLLEEHGVTRYLKEYTDTNLSIPSKESNEMIGKIIFRNVKKMYNFGYGIFIIDNNNNLYSYSQTDHPSRGY